KELAGVVRQAPGQQCEGREVPEEQAENSQGHKPGSVTHGQRGTEDQAEGMVRQARGSTGDGQQRSGSKQGQQLGR
ncbi:unnamed protein product, partial [Staurois parvus]